MDNHFLDHHQYVVNNIMDRDKLNEFLTETAFKAFKALGASGWGRVDYLLDHDNNAYLLEVNMVPGMTSHSLVPLAARTVGIEFSELVVRILHTTLADGQEG